MKYVLIVQADFELVLLLPQTAKCWDYTCASLPLAWFSLYILNGVCIFPQLSAASFGLGLQAVSCLKVLGFLSPGLEPSAGHWTSHSPGPLCLHRQLITIRNTHGLSQVRPASANSFEYLQRQLIR